MNKVELSDSDFCKLKQFELEILLEIDRICKLHGIKYTLAYGTLIGAVRHHGFIPWDDDIDICMMRSDYIKFERICQKELNSRFFYQSHETDREYFYLYNKIRMNDTIFKESVVSTYNIHHGVYVDIFPVDHVPDNKVVREMQFIKFHFFRTGLQSKYLNVRARSGWKKYIAYIMKILYAPISLEKLYRGACNNAQRYQDMQTEDVASFCSPYKKKDVFPKAYFENVTEGDFENYKFSIPVEYNEILNSLYGEYMQLPPEHARFPQHDLVELKL